MTDGNAVRTHCPNCGAKLKRPDLSLCAYCATPLQLGGKDTTTRDETLERLKRMRDHPQFAALALWRPADQAVLARTRKLRTIAGLLFLGAFGCGIVALQRGATASGVWNGAGLALVLVALVLLARAAAARKRVESRPLFARPAIVVERRSETAAEGTGATVYYFWLRFDDGSEGEFRWPGQGTLYEPWTNGMTGIAYTRGETLIELKRL
jgi:hypothetical protein